MAVIVTGPTAKLGGPVRAYGEVRRPGHAGYVIAASEYRLTLLLTPIIGYELFNLNFQSLEIVSRYRDPQLQVTKHYIVYHFPRFRTLFIPRKTRENTPQIYHYSEHQYCRGK